MKPIDVAAAVVVILVWAFNFVVGKVGVGQLPPLLMMALRFTLVAALLAPFLRPIGKPWRLIIALSVVFGGLHFGLLFSGLRGVDAGAAAIAIQLAVPFSALLARVFFAERLGTLQLLGMALAFGGVWLLAGEPSRPTSAVHFIMVVASALAWAMANVIIKWLGRIDVFVLNAWVAALAAPQLLLVTLRVEDGHWDAMAAADWRGWGAIVYMAVAASIVAYGLWYWLIRRHEVNRVVPLMLLSPVLAVLFASWMLDEPLTGRILLGGGLTLAGVAMIQFLKPKVRAPVPDPG